MRTYKFLGIFIILLFAVSGSSALQAQELPPGASAEVIQAKQKKEDREKLEEKKAKKEVEIKKEIPSPPKPAETLEILVRTIRLKGNPVIPNDVLSAYFKSYEGRNLRFSDLTALCRQLEDEYLKRGYVALVYVPQQKFENNEVKLQAVLSKMGEIHLEGATYFRDWKTLSYWKIPQGRLLRYDEMRSSLTEMNANPDRKVRASLRPGKETGFTDIYLKEEDHFPLHVGAFVDNQGAKLTGRDRVGFTLRDNNLLGLDDVLLASTTFGRTYGALGLQHLLPLNNNGTRLVTHFSHTQVNPKRELTPQGINGISESYGAEIRQMILKTDYSTLDAYLGFDFDEKKTRSLGATSVRDRLRVASLGGSFQTADEAGAWDIGQDLYFGLPFNNDYRLITSRHTGNSFYKYNFLVKRFQTLPFKTSASLEVQGQLSPDKLTPAEQLFIGGANTVRGYPESDYGADWGFMTNIEYNVPFFFLPDTLKFPGFEGPLKDKLNWIFFLDQGYGRLNQSSPEEHSSRNLWGTGAGITIHLNDNLTARVEWGFRLGDPALAEAGRSEFYFKLNAGF